MREFFLILAVIALLLGLTAYRYRKQLLAGLQIWRMLKEMRENVGTMPRPNAEPELKSAGKLVNCAKCGTWVANSKAIKLNSTMYFCSTKCVESNAS